MTMTTTHEPLAGTAHPEPRVHVGRLLRTSLEALAARIDEDGVEACEPELAALARAVRPRSRVLAQVLAGAHIAPMRERAFARAARVVMVRPAEHAALAVELQGLLLEPTSA